MPTRRAPTSGLKVRQKGPVSRSKAYRKTLTHQPPLGLKSLWARGMGHDIYVETEQWGQLYYARFPYWASKVALHFYAVFDAQHCWGAVSGNGGSISLHRHDLKALRRMYICHSKWNWGFNAVESRMALQIGESVQAIENYFNSTPPALADEIYFLIQQLPLPEAIAKRIAAYSSTDLKRVNVEFR